MGAKQLLTKVAITAVSSVISGVCTMLVGEGAKAIAERSSKPKEVKLPDPTFKPEVDAEQMTEVPVTEVVQGVSVEPEVESEVEA